MVEPWSELKKLQKEIEWAHQILDFYGAPRTLYNPYDGEDVELNIVGRISVWQNPGNESS